MPSEPIVLPIEDNGDSWFFLTWKQPNRVPGILAGFEIILKWEPLYHAPPWCSKKSVDPVQVDELTYAYNYTKAKAFAKYAVRVRAKTGAGWGSPGEPQTFHTKHKGVFLYILDFPRSILLSGINIGRIALAFSSGSDHENVAADNRAELERHERVGHDPDVGTAMLVER